VLSTTTKHSLAGYIQQRDGARLSLPPPSLKSATLSVSPNWNSSNTDPVKFPVTIDPAFGSFHVNLSIPATAQLVQYELSLAVENQTAVATENFQVADPRPPTAVLNVTTPDWVRSAALGFGLGGLPGLCSVH